MRIFTCTPVPFGGGPDFFARDSGLLCRGFRAIGVESLAVMPGERRAEDEEDLIRTDFSNLESAKWWREHGLDAVVLYAWGSPRFRRVARAIHDAGIILILNQDNGGLVSPLAGFSGWLREQWNLSGGGTDFITRSAKGFCHGLLVTDPLRAAHLRCGDIIACVSPQAALHYRGLCRTYGGRDFAERVRVLPHAVETRFMFSGATKKRQVACVGRWSDRVQKRPHLLTEVIGELVAVDESLTVVIAGNPIDHLLQWHGSMRPQQRERVQLRGMVGRDDLVNILNTSQVFYSPSAFESFGIAAAEALCCGCSVVAAESVSMAAFEWFVSEDSGKLTGIDDARGHADALATELGEWRNGRRDAVGISEIWCARLHADRVAARVVAMLSEDCADLPCPGVD